MIIDKPMKQMCSEHFFRDRGVTPRANIMAKPLRDTARRSNVPSPVRMGASVPERLTKNLLTQRAPYVDFGTLYVS